MTTPTPMTAIGWQLFRSPQPSPKGGFNPARQHQIAIFDNFVVIGSGRASGSAMIYRVERFANADYARSYALNVTEKHEAAGYTLGIGPRIRQTKDDARAFFEDKHLFKGKSEELAAALESLLLGPSLESMYPAESPAS